MSKLKYDENKIVMRLVNTEANKDTLQDMPHRDYADFSDVYGIYLGGCDKDAGRLLISPIYNSTIEKWGINEDKLHELAMKNMKRILPPSVKTMGEVIQDIYSDMIGKDEEGVSEFVSHLPICQDLPGKATVYVISNTFGCDGAAAMIYGDKSLAILANRLDSDLYIFPSSTDEVLAVSAEYYSDENDLSAFADMVREVNMKEDCVPTEKLLSNHVFLYDRAANAIIVADGKDKREEVQADIVDFEQIRHAVRHR